MKPWWSIQDTISWAEPLRGRLWGLYRSGILRRGGDLREGGCGAGEAVALAGVDVKLETGGKAFKGSLMPVPVDQSTGEP